MLGDRPSSRRWVFFAFVWLSLMSLPWARLLPRTGDFFIAFTVDMLCVGLAIILFIVPGSLLYILLRWRPCQGFDWEGCIPAGFVFSVLISSVIGFGGRVLGLSFSEVKILFILFCMIETWVLIRVSKHTGMPSFVSSEFRKYLPLFWVCMLSVGLTFHDLLFFYDDTTYLAYLTNWQYADRLGFQNIIHDSHILELERFWFAMYPMSQAVISDVSSVPGLLLFSHYLELFLVPLAVLSSFWLFRQLNLSVRTSTLAILVHLSIICWMIGKEWPVGNWYFQSMAEDKVSAAFHLAPVFFAFTLNYIQVRDGRRFILVLFGGLCLTLTHPIILFFACLIAICMVGCAWVSQYAGKREFAGILLVAALSMFPYLLIRIGNYSSQAGFDTDSIALKESFQVERYIRFAGDFFYGINPGVLKFTGLPLDGTLLSIFEGVRWFPALLALCAGFTSLLRLRKGPLYWYIFSCTVLIILAIIPYTGWILGSLSNARLLSRISWFLPLGLSAAVIWALFAATIQRRMSLSVQSRLIRGSFTGTFFAISLASPILLYGNLSRVPAYFQTLDHNRQLTEMGRYIDFVSSRPVTVFSIEEEDADLLPGISFQARLISFREEKPDNGHNYYMTLEEIETRISDSQTLRSLDVAIFPSKRCDIVRNYEVRFVLSATDDSQRFQDYLQGCPVQITVALTTADLVLFEIESN